MKYLIIIALCFQIASCKENETLSIKQNQQVQGGIEGGGGKGLACANMPIKTLDLFEAESLGQAQLDTDFQNIDQNISYYAEKTAQYFKLNTIEKNEMIKNALHLKKNFQDISLNQTLSLSDDADLPNIPIDCSIVQVAFFNKSGVYSRDLNLWNKMNTLNQTSLIFHELIYSGMKLDNSNISKSNYTRFIVGKIFSKDFAPQYAPTSQSLKKVLICGLSTDMNKGEFSTYGVSFEEKVQNGQFGTYLQIFKSDNKNEIYLTHFIAQYRSQISFSKKETNNIFNYTNKETLTFSEKSLTGIDHLIEIQPVMNTRINKDNYGILISMWSPTAPKQSSKWLHCLTEINPK